MSPNVGNFVHELVEMAKATETLPQVQAELSAAKTNNENLISHIESIRADLEQSRNYVASLEQKVRSLEVERDDASFRVMEAEDREHNVLAMAKAARVSLDQMTGLLDPPKPEPEKLDYPTETLQPQAVPTPTQDEKNAAHASSMDVGSSTTATSSAEEAPKSDANPPESSSMESGDGSILGVCKGPYFGKHHHDLSFYVSLNDWLAGDGAHDDYYPS